MGKKKVIIFISILFVFYVISEFGFRSLEQSRHKIDAARALYLSSLMQTKIQLAGHLNDLAHDSALVSNFISQQSYSLSHSIDTETYPGSFDFYVIFDENCKPITKTHSVILPEKLCEKKNNSAGKWRWFDANSKGLLFLLKTRTDVDKTFSIGGGRYLDTNWIRSFPTLLTKLREADLILEFRTPDKKCMESKICSLFNSIVYQEGTDPKLALVSKSKIFPLIRPWLVSRTPLSNPFSLPLLLFIGIFLIVELLQQRAAKSREEKSKQKFLDWCDQEKRTLLPIPEWTWLEQAQEKILKQSKQDSERLAHTLKEYEKQSSHIQDLHNQIEELKRKLSLQIPHTVLVEQFVQNGQEVHNMVLSFLEESADMESILETGLLPPNRKMMDLLKNWQHSISIRGERTFMRSLYEQSSAKEGETLLMSEIKRLFDYAEQMNSTTLHSVILLKQAQKNESKARVILENWLWLAGQLGEIEKTLNEICKVAAELLQMQSTQRISYLGTSIQNVSLKVPSQSLLSAFYLIFAAIKKGLKNTEEENLVFQIHKRHKNQQFILALSLTTERGKLLVSHTDDNLLQQALEVLSPFSIEFQEIHRPEGGTYLVIKGDEELIVDKESVSSSQADQEASIS